MSKTTYEVFVGNIGTVYHGPDAEEANALYEEYRGQSTSNYGRAAGESVVLFVDGEIEKETVQENTE